MTPFEDLAQFRDLARHLPDVAFAGGGIEHPRLCLFAATHTDREPEAVRKAVADLPFDAAFTAAVSRADADLRLYELDIANPVTALGQGDAARAAAYGMMAVEPGPDLFALATLVESPGAARRIAKRLAGGDEPLAVMAEEGGRDIPALLGALMAARMAGLPVILDGANALAALAILHALAPGAITHCAVPLGAGIAADAARLGVRAVACADPRPLFCLADAAMRCRALVIS